jgi:flagellar hook-associated protein 3 FlgL
MNYVSVGDMAQSFQLRQHNTQLKTTLSRLSEEVASGIKHDIGAAVAGDFSSLSGINRSLSMIDSYNVVTTEAALTTDTMQTTLSVIQSLSSDAGTTLLSAATNSSSALIDITAADAAVKFDSIIASLNTNVAGRYVFSGAATDTAPLASPENILSALRTEISGASSPDDTIALIDGWFAAPAGGGGFLDTGYLGDDSLGLNFRIAEGETTSIDSSASDPRIRDAIKGFAIASLMADGLHLGDQEARSTLSAAAGERILSGSSGLTGLAVEIGSKQGKIADAHTRNQAETTSLQLARSELISADPYESATALEAVSTQLETLYTLTSRLSRLSLADYL